PPEDTLRPRRLSANVPKSFLFNSVSDIIRWLDKRLLQITEPQPISLTRVWALCSAGAPRHVPLNEQGQPCSSTPAACKAILCALLGIRSALTAGSPHTPSISKKSLLDLIVYSFALLPDHNICSNNDSE